MEGLLDQIGANLFRANDPYAFQVVGKFTLRFPDLRETFFSTFLTKKARDGGLERFPGL
jgi:hypothetical protein